MLHPSYTDLMDAVNDVATELEHPVVQSRYSIVLATAKRARQIISGADVLVENPSKKALSAAVDEFYKKRVTILTEENEGEEQTANQA